MFFPGGDIGRLCISGTVNDLAVSGAFPKYISVGMIIEAGFDVSSLIRITQSMAATAKEAGVHIVTGDTKVVEGGSADGIFINTAGIGVFSDERPQQTSFSFICFGRSLRYAAGGLSVFTVKISP